MAENILRKKVIFHDKQTNEEIPYRIIEVGPTILMIKMDCRKFKFLRYDKDIFASLLTTQAFTVEEDSSNYEITPDQLSAIVLQKMAIERFLDSVGKIEGLEVHKNKGAAYQELCEELKISYATAVRLVRKYLQNGRTEAALLDRRSIIKKKKNNRIRNGKKRKDGLTSNVLNDDVLQRNFELAFKDLMDSVNAKCGTTIRDAYDQMIMKRYTTTTINEAGEIVRQEADTLDKPTYKQFYLYVRKELGDIPFRKIKNGFSEYRNNHRVLIGNAQYRVYYSGQLVEIDETEDDIKLVSIENGVQVVGRAVVYIAIDAYSGAIVGASVHMKNNSFSGVSEVLMSMLEPHRLQTERYGVRCSDSEFPSEFIPQEYRLDHGAEYEAEAFANVCQELQIDQHLLPVAGGSWKGQVERTHALFRGLIRNQVKHNGLILKNGNSKKAEKEACLTIEDLRKIVYRIIIHLNTTARENCANLDRKMMEEFDDYTPEEKWKYGLQAGKTRLVTDNNRTACFWGILRHDGIRKFRLTREGIKYRDLRYVLKEKWFINMVSALTKNSVPIDVRYDPRSIDKVFYEYESQIYEIPLAVEKRENLQSFLGLEWDDYDKLYQMKLDKTRENNSKSATKRRMLKAEIKNIVQEAEDNHPKSPNRIENQRGAALVEKMTTSMNDARYREKHSIPIDVKKADIPEEIETPKQIDVPFIEVSSSEVSQTETEDFDVDDYFGD